MFWSKRKASGSKQKKEQTKTYKKMKMFSNKVENTMCVEEKWKTISLE